MFVALDLDPRNLQALAALERLYDGEPRARALAEELGRRAARLDAAAAAPLHYGRGRAAERAGDRAAAREAYRRAVTLDPTLAEPIAALGALAARDGNWSEVAALLDSELRLATSASRKGPLVLELAVVHGDKLNDPARAVALLDAAVGYLGDEPRVLDLGARFNLAAGNWQAAADALEKLASRGAPIADAAERYFAVAAAAEAAGQQERALALYSRSYGRDSSFRPTLERLAHICFERGQWDNAWKATEALLARHGGALDPAEHATVLTRSMLIDLHIGQRVAAVARLGALVTRGASYVPDAGIRDVAESWAGMHLDPRLLVDIEPRRRERVRARAREVIALIDGQQPHPARAQVMEMLGALALSEEQWDNALAALEELATDAGFDAFRRSDFMIAAGDIVVRRQGERAAGQPFYNHARTLWPDNPALARAGISPKRRRRPPPPPPRPGAAPPASERAAPGAPAVPPGQDRPDRK